MLISIHPKELQTGIHIVLFYMNVHSSIIFNRQKVKTIQCPSMDEWITKCGMYVLTKKSIQLQKKLNSDS